MLLRCDLKKGDKFRYKDASWRGIDFIVDMPSTGGYFASYTEGLRNALSHEVELISPAPSASIQDPLNENPVVTPDDVARGSNSLPDLANIKKSKEPVENHKVTAQAHYQQMKPEPIEVMEAWFSASPRKFSALKYLARAGRKPHEGSHVQGEIRDLEKAISFLQREVNYLKTGVATW